MFPSCLANLRGSGTRSSLHKGTISANYFSQRQPWLELDIEGHQTIVQVTENSPEYVNLYCLVLV